MELRANYFAKLAAKRTACTNIAICHRNPQRSLMTSCGICNDFKFWTRSVSVPACTINNSFAHTWPSFLFTTFACRVSAFIKTLEKCEFIAYIIFIFLVFSRFAACIMWKTTLSGFEQSHFLNLQYRNFGGSFIL